MSAPKSEAGTSLKPDGLRGSRRHLVAAAVFGLVVICVGTGILLSALFGGGPLSNDQSLEPGPEWSSTDLGVGTLFLPQDIQRIESDPSADGGMKFASPEMSVFVEWGDDVASPAGRAADVERDSGTIDGHNVELYSFSGVSEGNLPGESLGQWEVMHMTLNRSDLEVSVWVTYSRSEDATTADRIVRAFSVK